MALLNKSRYTHIFEVDDYAQAGAQLLGDAVMGYQGVVVSRATARNQMLSPTSDDACPKMSYMS